MTLREKALQAWRKQQEFRTYCLKAEGQEWAERARGLFAEKTGLDVVFYASGPDIAEADIDGIKIRAVGLSGSALWYADWACPKCGTTASTYFETLAGLGHFIEQVQREHNCTWFQRFLFRLRARWA